MRPGLTRRTVIASAALALIVAAAFAALVRAVDEERDSSRLAQHSAEVLASANAFERLVVDLETGPRGFLLTNDERFLEPWDAARRAVPAASQDLLRLAQVRAQHRRAQGIAAAIGSYVRDYSIPLVAAARRGDASARTGASVAEGKRLVDAIRVRFADLIAAERRLAARRDDRSDRDARWAIAAAVVGLAGSMLLVAFFGGLMIRSIVAPLRRAADMAGRVAGGDLSARMPETGAAEMGDLQRSFNAMVRSLEANRDELRLIADEQAALRRVATLVARAVPPDEVFDAAAVEAARLLEADAAWMLRLDPDRMVTVAAAGGPGNNVLPAGRRVPLDETKLVAAVLRTGEPAHLEGEENWPWAPGTLGDQGLGIAIGTPVFVADRVWGVMAAAWWHADVPIPETQERLGQFTALAAAAIANAHSRAQLAASRARVVATADQTRRRIERDLHDGAQQRLVHTVVTLKLARRELEDGGPAAQLVDEALEQAETATEALRELVHGILPSALSRGLAPAVEGLVERVPLPVSVDVAPARVPEALERTAYFVIAEALTNVVKHAGAQRAVVRARIEDATLLRVEVSDDGAGGARLDGSTGLLGLLDRVASINGTLSVESPLGGGTTIVALLPIPG